jgi:2-hydroxy-3-keto-5-methylthiopentenyl-1-phosphate phosphatase
MKDCPLGDDENRTDVDNTLLIANMMEIDSWFSNELDMLVKYAKKNILFQTICDGFTELLPITIEGQNETDETECEQWQCNNTYTRCNGLWNCLNGADEIGCDLSPSLLYFTSHKSIYVFTHLQNERWQS